MESFAPLFFLVIISLAVSMISKVTTAAKKAAPPKRPASAPKQDGPSPSAPAAEGAAAAESPERKRVLQPSIQVTDHDDSIYQGSLNAVTGEGCDPCHDEQMASLTLAETAEPVTEAAAPSPILPQWTGSEIARGFVMAEILTRRERIGK